MSLAALFRSKPRVVNIGLDSFASELAARGVAVAHVDWRPPAGGKPEIAALLAALGAHEKRIARANAQAVRRIVVAEPILEDVMRADQAIPQLGERMLLHAGPPLSWARMCGPMRGAIAGAIVFEGWAASLAAAARLAASGGVRMLPNHHFGAVGPMTGITTRSMPVLVVKNRAKGAGNRAFCTVNEGLGKVMRFGANDASVLERLAWLRDEFGPALGAALRSIGGLELSPLIARGLAMGDEMHQRNVACSALTLRALAPALAKCASSAEVAARALSFIGANEQFFLNVAMAMGKCMTDPARGIEACSLVTAMCRNGTDFGIRVSATGDAWFTAPVELPKGLYFPGYSERDANGDMGDSAIVETIGLGAFAMAAAPAVAGFVGAGRASDAQAYTRAMAEITTARNPKWALPPLDMEGVPVGIDVRRVVESGVRPAINTGIAHRKAGVGQVGAGIARAPLTCFEGALRAFAATLGVRA